MSSGIEKLTADNHALYRRVQHLVGLRWKWEAIADDVGLVGPRAVQDLCEWVLEYREPKKSPMVKAKPIREVVGKSKSYSTTSERFIAWRRQHEGAKKAREDAGL